jgi:hypothetical protein
MTGFRISLCCLGALVLSSAAHAQFDAPPQFGFSTPRIWFVVSDGVGPSGGGLAGTTGLSQLMRGAAVVNVARGLGAEAGVLRIQEIVPAVKVANDKVQNDPRADGVYLGITQFSREGSRQRIPAFATIGGAVMRRPTNTPGETRLTSGIIGGFESQLADPFPGPFDMTAGLRAVLMPGGNHRQLYVLALNMGLRLR